MGRLRFGTGVLLATLWVGPLGAQAPTGTIHGHVTQAGSQRPLQGATITVAGRSAVSGTDGSYRIPGVPAGTDTLRARMIGYAPVIQAVTVAAGQTLEVDLALTTQAVKLAEVVAVGYGEQQAANLTGAVTNVTADEFNTGRIVSPTELIQNKVAGVQVVESNEPGGKTSLRIRGATSINASSEPLIVIDGVPVGGGLSAGRDPLNFLNSDDIESITVLRDASAAAIYGANAANGVVMIQTKHGRGRPSLEYSGSFSASTVDRLPSMLNADQFRAAVEAHAASKAGQLGDANTDWFSLVDRTAYGQEHNVAVSGAGEKMDYRLSLNYLDQNGIMLGTTTQRLGLGLNYNQRLFGDRLNLRTNLRGTRTYDEFTPGGVLSNAAQMGPTQPVFDSTTKSGYFDWSTQQSADNPVAILNLATDKGTTYRGIGNVQAEYSLPGFNGLSANANLGFDVTQAERETFTPSVLHSQKRSGSGGTYFRRNPDQLSTVLETYLKYAAPQNVGPGKLDLAGGYSYSQTNIDSSWVSAQNLSTDLLGTNGIPAAKTVQNYLDVQDSRLISFFGRLNYNIDDRYLAAFSVRHDGSSRFGPEHAWGTFPSVALAWRLSQEPFMQRMRGISDLKLRGSWARTGNQAFPNYQQYSAYMLGDAQTQYMFGDTVVTTIRPGAVDTTIRWESTRSYDLGVDFGFANQRFSGAVDWYDKKTNDLIFTVPVPAGTNLSNFVTTNIGSMRNRGLEFSLSAKIAQGGQQGLSWTADLTAARNSNELLTINPVVGPGDRILTGLVAGGVGTNIQVLMPGQPINSFYVYEHKRDASGKPIYADENGDGTINQQDLYVDQNGDGKINQDDLRPFHDPAPKWILGHSSYFGYRNFDFGFTLRAYLGNYVYNNVASNLGSYEELRRDSPYNLHTSVLETNFDTPQYQSDYYVEKASFLRVDNITLGYSFNYRGMPARLFGTLQNAFTVTGYSGVDPTAGLNGIDNNIYPRSRTFTGGLSFRF